nr:AraC family transcriptional regulator [uncultured Hyphomonas sp.]
MDDAKRFTEAHQGSWREDPISYLELNGGNVSFEKEEFSSEQRRAGLKLAILFDGEFDLAVEDGSASRAFGACFYLFHGRRPWRLDHRFHAASHIRYLTINIDEEGLGEGLAVSERGLDQERDDVDGVSMRQAGISAEMNALAAQIMTCPFEGSARSIFLGAKALEITAMAMEHFGEGAQAPTLLSPREIRRLKEAAALLRERCASPPSLAELARFTGLNVRKLTHGFRSLYGKSVGEYVRDYRMREAWRLLVSGASDVTRTAELVGYTLPHFSSAFQRAYGVNPSTIARRSDN